MELGELESARRRSGYQLREDYELGVDHNAHEAEDGGWELDAGLAVRLAGKSGGAHSHEIERYLGSI